MINYRSAALTLAACAAGLAVTACTAGITTASSPTTSAPAPTRSASVRAAASSRAPSGRAPSGRMIKVTGSVGSFPVPTGAKVTENIAIDQKDVVVAFNSVTPANVSSFYATALPRAGYTISGNSVVTQGGSIVAFVFFSGHGYKGDIGALSKPPASEANLGLGTKNVTTITFMLK
jgi:ABC-type phosphate transport system substrate-binding protein